MDRICPKHNKPLREGKNGSWYCATRVGAGWCDYREYTQTYTQKFSQQPSGQLKQTEETWPPAGLNEIDEEYSQKLNTIIELLEVVINKLGSK